MSGSILVVDDEVQLARHLRSLLAKEGYDAAVAHDPEDARAAIARLCPDVVLMDLRLGTADGGLLLEELKGLYPASEFIIITAHGSIRSVVECTRRGAIDYLTKPFEPDELLLTIRNALGRNVLRAELDRLRRSGSDGDGDLTSASPAMRSVATNALQAARQEGIVLLLGESGVGKDHMARFLHAHSRRAAGPFFTVNCAALSRELAESELFGHEPGAFTGSHGRKRGLLELAEKGTLLLNEVGELDPIIQAKLLTFLDTRTFLRVGGERTIAVDARIFAATNRDLESEVERGAFRRDLFYRLNVIAIELPPLRERIEDLPVLVAGILARLTAEMGHGPGPRLSADAMHILAGYPWPGNIRELRNVLERALMFAAGSTIEPRHLNLPAAANPAPPGEAVATWDFHEATREVGRKLVTEALRRTSTRKEAAELLGLSRHALAYQVKALGLDE